MSTEYTEYVAHDNEMLDAISMRHYGHESAITAVLEANPQLARLGPVLTAGTRIVLPKLETPPTTTAMRLWE